jgi:hypothetical protein
VGTKRSASLLVATLGAAILCLPLVGCLPMDGQVHGTMVVRSAPPPAEVVVVTPRAGYVWVDGQWMWANGQWGWYEGYWIAARPNYRFERGRWERHQRGHVWIEPRWVHVQTRQTVRVTVKPGRQPVRVRDHRGNDQRRGKGRK